MIRLVLVSSLILVLGFYEAKCESNDLPVLKNDEALSLYKSYPEKWVKVASYGRVVEGKEYKRPTRWARIKRKIKLFFTWPYRALEDGPIRVVHEWYQRQKRKYKKKKN
ncbi:uncharacterized protein LOC128990415 [Macrosteles quadrilineatus]|uniref:uncharacterized protein LOC128990415 n=1 Tax=Macrosteles quadrilineatus TaxID=74068 RepID=UPI0023E2802C|nr:uncharacterized protein LOC128990415 [Macrosteles quadrilineatus]